MSPARATTRLLPSGDQSGREVVSSASLVSRRSPEPSGFTVQRSLARTKASLVPSGDQAGRPPETSFRRFLPSPLDRKSTRLNSSHLGISYAVFCLKKKKK